MKIALMNQDFPPYPGGIAQWAYGLTQGFAALGHSITIYTRAKAIGNCDIHQSQPYTVVKMHGRDFNRYRRIYCSYYATKIVMSRQFDLFIAGTWNLAAMAVFLSKYIPIKTVVVAHGWEVTRDLNPLLLKELRYVLKNATAGIAVSHFTKQRILEKIDLPNDSIDVIPNGVSLDRFYQMDHIDGLRDRWNLDGKKIILTLARIVERKGHDVVIKAMPHILQKHPQAVYMIAGGGSKQTITHLRSLVDQLGLQEHVIFTGYIDDADLVKYYNLCDIYVMVSRELKKEGDTEGFGITYLEANACGKPVIGGRSGGVPDAVIDGQTGFLVDPLDERAVAEKIITLLDHPHIARQMGFAGAERVRNELTWVKIAKRFIDCFDS